MRYQDNDATIKCVCVVIRTHMIEASKQGIVPLKEYDVFKDLPSSSPTGASTKTTASPAAHTQMVCCGSC